VSNTPEYEKTVAAGSDRHMPGLDGLRGVACLLVFVYHLRWAAGDPALTIGGFDMLRVMKNCDIGVAIFFALSGLLLSMPYWRAIYADAPWPECRRYLWRRACRILPAYYACLVVVYLLRDGTYTFYGFLDFLLHAGFAHTFSDQSYLSVYGPLWTIGIEFQFYLLLPAMMAAIAWLTRKAGVAPACLALVAVTGLLGFIVRAALVAVEPSISDRFLANDGPVILSGTIFHYLKYFAVGIAGGALVLHWRRSKAGLEPLIAGSLAGVGTIVLLFASSEAAWRQTQWTGWPLNLVLFTLLAASLSAAPMLARFFELRPLVFAGEISYGIYLWHDLVLRAVFGGTLPGRLAGWPLVLAGGAVALGVTVLIAWLSYRTIERPAMKASYPFVTASAT
jgi:peptidoglycan/LPS O-acetylase OafA/YrhL